MSDDARAWEDRDAIQQLIYRYSDAVTRADYEQMATVFAADAVWESPILGMHFESARGTNTNGKPRRRASQRSAEVSHPGRRLRARAMSAHSQLATPEICPR
jgi:ketosteroid isomerase-like protein